MEITVRIKLREGHDGENFVLKTGSEEDTQKLNNISLKVIQDDTFTQIPNKEQGMKLLSFIDGNLRFNQNNILSNFDYQDGYLQKENDNEIVFGPTDSNGNYEVELEIDNASGLSSFVVYGDSIANQFPTELTIDDEPFYSDDYKLVIPLDSTKSTHSIIFKKWNRPNYNACITMIRATMNYLTFTNTAIDSLKSVERNNVDASEINYGVLANSGSVEFLDADGEIQDLVNDGIIQNSNVLVDILLNENILQNHISNDSNYETAQKMFSMSLSNKIEMLDKLKYEGFAYPENSYTLYTILKMVMTNLLNIQLDDSDTGTFRKMLSNKCMTPSGEKYIYEYLQNISIKYPVIEYGYTYRQVIDDICKIAQLNMFVNKNNEFEFMSARPLLLSEDFSKMIRITRDTLKQPPSYDLFMKNQYQAVEIGENSVSDAIDYDTVVYPANIQFNNIQDSDFTLYTKTNQHIEQRSQFESSATFYYEIVSFILSNYYTYQGTITVPKKSLNNLTQITFINESLFRSNNFAYNIKYNKYIGDVTADSVWDRGDNEVTVSNITYSTESFGRQVSENGVVQDISNYTYTLPDTTQTTSSTLTQPNNPQITLLSDDENFYVTYIITVQKKLTKLGGAGRWTAASTSSINIPLTGEFEYYIPLELEFSIYGNKRVISFDNTSVSSTNVNEAEVVVNFGNTTTKLLQDKCTYNGKKMSSVIKDNILSDYQYGVSNLRLEMFTTDLNYKDGTRAKTLDNGEVLDVGDIAFLSGDKDKSNQQRYWCVYDNQYSYDGSVDESVKLYQKREYYGLYNEKYFIGWNALIDSGDLIVETISNNKYLYTTTGNTKLSGKLVISLEENIKYIGRYIDNVPYGFINCTKLEEILLPTTITYLGEQCFSGCTNLKNINIPQNVTALSFNIFKNCTSLEKIYIPNNITYINGGAFEGCTGLQNIFIPNSVTGLGSQIEAYSTKVFYNCSSTLVIYCEASEKPVNWQQNWNVYNSNNDTLTVKWGYTRQQYEEEISNNT